VTTIHNPAHTNTGYAARLTGTLPRDDQHNGLTTIAKTLTDDPRTIRLAIVAYDVAKTIENVADGSLTAVIRLLRIEPLDGPERGTASKLLLAANKNRTGQQLDLHELMSHDDDPDE